MRTRTIRLALLGVTTAGVVLTQQACANGTAAAPTVSEVAATPSSPATSSSPAKPSSPATTAADGSVPVCRTSDIEATITLQPGGGSTRRGLVTLTNEGDIECTIGGRAAISLKNPADEVVDVPARNVDEPGKAVRSVLKVGSSVFQGIKWTVCDKGDATCAAGNTLVFNLEASTDGRAAKLEGFPAPERNDITMKSLQIGTIQPSRQGVVAW
ncbi:DUF4232 domain-containing protein [Actinoplanes sp. NPDC049596]|uniref:DUF4232 domain-containing protein n=1 Tax=unclassified Actinoplanes TaxID=2626549 RepID=UPI0034256B65